MDRLPLRLLAFALGPWLTKRAAAMGRSKAVGASAVARQLRTPGGATLRGDAEEGARRAAASDGATEEAPVPPWLFASAAAAALFATAAAVSTTGGGLRTRAPPATARETAARELASRSADFGGA